MEGGCLVRFDVIPRGEGLGTSEITGFGGGGRGEGAGQDIRKCMGVCNDCNKSYDFS